MLCESLLTCSHQGSTGGLKRHEKPRGVEEWLLQSLLSLSEWVVVGTSDRPMQYGQDLAMAQELRGGTGWSSKEKR